MIPTHFNCGWTAADEGFDVSDCPFAQGTLARTEWVRGFYAYLAAVRALTERRIAT
jgi:hypothetical protein